MVKLACMTLPYAKYSFERSLEGIARAGYKYVSFGLFHEGEDVPSEDNPQAAEKMERLFKKYGLRPISLIGNKQLAPGQPLERAVQRFELAERLQIPEILSVGTRGYEKFPDKTVDDETFTKENGVFVEHFRQVAKEAEKRDLVITLKPHTGNTAIAPVLKETLSQIGSPAVRACYDPGNVRFYEGVEPDKDIEAIAGETYSLIAKDHRGERANPDFPIPGEGDVNFGRIFELLGGGQFDGVVTVERVDGADRGPIDPEEIDRRIAQAKTNLEQLLDSAGLACA